MQEKISGAVLWRGPSTIDGKPIVLIVTGLNKGSKNSKTGKMLQTFVLREDVHPWEAVQTGQDKSICGTCEHRGVVVNENGESVNKKRSCYVVVGQAPSVVWKAYHRGIYPERLKDAGASLLAGHSIRVGSYGDPGAVPFRVWEKLLKYAANNTGYTQRWKKIAKGFSKFLMASANSEKSAKEAQALGYRTFRVSGSPESIAKPEVMCPASAERGKVTTCSECLACGGLQAKAKANIAIVIHGGKSKKLSYQARA